MHNPDCSSIRLLLRTRTVAVALTRVFDGLPIPAGNCELMDIRKYRFCSVLSGYLICSLNIFEPFD